MVRPPKLFGIRLREEVDSCGFPSLGWRGFWPEPVTATGVVAEKASTGKRMEDLKAVVANAEAVKAASLII